MSVIVGREDGLGRLKPSKSMTGLGDLVSVPVPSVFCFFLLTFFSGSSLGSLAALLRLFFRLDGLWDVPLTSIAPVASLALLRFLPLRDLFSSPFVGGGWLSSWTESSGLEELRSMALSLRSFRVELAN